MSITIASGLEVELPFDRQSEERISRTVQEWERFPAERVFGRAPQGTSIGLPQIVTLAEDIEHFEFGLANLTTGTDFDGTLTEDSSTQFTVWNPGLKAWDGATAEIAHTRLPTSGKAQWVIKWAWSATRLECTAPAGGIAAGGSGTCSSPTNMNGHFGASSLTVHSWTSSIAIQGSEELLAELYWDSSNTESRWRVYSADCT